MASDVLDLFLELTALPSPPGEERAVADAVLRYLRQLGLEADEDDAGPRVGSTIGNLFARVEPTADGGTPLFFCAHLDTVPPTGPIEPVVDDGVVLNSADTILGADNESAARADRRGDDRERRHHPGRYRRQHRARVVHVSRGSAVARRAQAPGCHPGDARRDLVRGRSRGLRGRD